MKAIDLLLLFLKYLILTIAKNNHIMALQMYKPFS